MKNSLLAVSPSVFAVEGEYQICALVQSECTMWVEVEGKSYFDHSNGILRTGKFLHIAHIPMAILEKERRYTVCLQRIVERKPYFTEYGEIEKTSVEFRPITSDEKIHIINLADAHNLVEEPILAGSHFGDSLDLLVLNGDIPNHAGCIDYFKAIYEIAGRITKGECPTIFSRGNHDMRGIYAEQLENYTPTAKGKSYFTFRLGAIWGMVLDAGEDKPDDTAAYGHTICCSAFREEEEAFIDQVLEKEEWKDSTIRILISHQPFSWVANAPFEKERYSRWCQKLEKIGATAWLTGHLHRCFLENPKGPHDLYGTPCPLVCSSYREEPEEGKYLYACGAITLSKERGIESVRFITQEKTDLVLP